MTTVISQAGTEIFSAVEDCLRTGPINSIRNCSSVIPDDVCWSAAELEPALGYLVQRSSLPVALERLNATSLDAAPPNPAVMNDEVVDRWIGALVGRLGLEAEPVQSTYGEAIQYLRESGPALLKLPRETERDELSFVALLSGSRWWVQLIAHDGSVQRIRHEVLQDALWVDVAGEQPQSIEQMLVKAGVAPERHYHIQRALLREVCGSTVRRNGWLLRLPPSADLWHQVVQAGLLRTTSALVGGYCAQLLLTVAAWWMIGRSALAGHFDWGWLSGWALLLVTTLPFQAWVNLTQSQLAIGIGAIFKQRLLYGVMQLDPEEIRHQGPGQFLGRVLASNTVEQLGLASGFVAVLAIFQLLVSAVILALGVGGWFHGLLLLLWVGFTAGLSYFYWRPSRGWVEVYRTMTNDLVERMVGHRTRLAQEDRAHWHDAEDQRMSDYLQVQTRLDQLESQLKAVVLRGWMVIGVGGLIYALLSARPSPTQIAISLGGILFAYQALTTIVLGLKGLVGARLAWQEVSSIFRAATRCHGTQTQMDLAPVQVSKSQDRKAPLMIARDINFRYQSQGRQILQACNLRIYQGEWLLLEGPSGGGKSTLISLLAGLRTPQSGLLLLHDVDQETMGVATWRERVVAVPQFHENYVLTGTLAFNLLMGRRWPPHPDELAKAEALCRELGLGELIDRMPAGMQQMVGESGWQLSHGERSRLYIARALLQEADLVILDESFAALDPANLERALRCVLERAATLLVIAHP